MEKTKIPNLAYNAMFRAVISNNKYILSKLVEYILDYYQLDIDISGKELTIQKNELNINNYQDKQLIVDYIIKLDDKNEINIEINRSKYIGLTERNLTYSFKIYYEHFKAGDSYKEFGEYTFLQVNFNNYRNPNGRSINRYYMIDADDLKNKLSKNFSIMNIDIDLCHKLVYNKDNLEGISDLEVFSALLACDYLEDIASILERGLLSMEKSEKEKFTHNIYKASQDKDIQASLKLENTWEERMQWIEDIIRREATKEATEKATREVTEQVTKEVTEQVTKDVTEQVTKEVSAKKDKEIDNMIKNMIKQKLSYEQIRIITGKTIAEIKTIEKS